MNPSQEPVSSGGIPHEPQPAAARPYDAADPTGPQHPVGQSDGVPPADGHGWYPGPWTPLPRPPRRPWRRSLAVGALTVLAIVAAGVPLGLLWSWISPAVPVLESRQGDVVVNDPSPEQFVAADGSFTLLGFGFGVLVAVAAWLILRRHRGPVLLLSVVLGALGAAGVAWQVGRRLGLGDYQRWTDVAVAGDTFDRPPDLHAYGTLLVPAFIAAIVCTLLAGWSNDPDLDVPGARPGYGHDLSGPPRADPAGYDLSSGSPAGPGPTGAPAPPGSESAAPPRG